MTAQDIAKAVADNAKSGKWLSCTFPVEHPNAVGGTISVGVKAFGKWVQIIQVAEFKDSVPEQKTIKALKEKTAELVQALLDTVLGSVPAKVERTYYLVKVGPDRWDMRQTRYKSQLAAGKEHPHDLCAVSFPADQMRDMVEKHKFDVDLSVLEDGQ